MKAGAEKRQANGFRYATLSYVIALLVIASLSVGTHLLIDAIIRHEAETARVVNVAGRQRMLSQRISMLSMEAGSFLRKVQTPDLDRALDDAIALMAKSHSALSVGSKEMGIPADRTDAQTALYRSAPHDLDRRVPEFLDMARAFHALPAEQRAGSPLLGQLLAARDPLLHALDAAVLQYQKDSEAAIAGLRAILRGVLSLMLATLVIEALFVFRPLFLRLRKTQDELLAAALTDPLTGCMNRRHLMERAEQEVERARRTGTPLSVLMLDIDHFKSINDTWGHAVGDVAILTMASTTLETIRRCDILGRIGGEEFVLILPDTPVSGAIEVAEKLRLAIATAHIPTEDKTIHMTVSIGVTQAEAADDTFTAALDRADQALYDAKRNGRDQVRLLTSTETAPV